MKKAKRRVSGHIFLSKDAPIPVLNGTVLTIVQIIKCIMCSAAEAELASLFIIVRKCV